MPRVLIIAYGNPLRSDDGVAWRAAGLLEGRFPAADVEILRLHQLAPELAETLRRCQAAIFVDAAARGLGAPGEIRFEEIRQPAGEARFSHQLSPDAVVALARQLYGAAPRAFAVTLAGENFDHGEQLSPVVAEALPLLAARVEEVTRRLLRVPSSS